MNISFSLIALDLRLQPDGHALKVLNKDILFFDQRYVWKNGHIERNASCSEMDVLGGLYGENMQVQAIVGKNGSGKSSLLEIIYRVINNFSYTILNELREPNNLVFSEGLHADLYYQIEGVIYCITCFEHIVGLYKINGIGEREWIYNPDDPDDEITISDISKHLFYTIVTNYAPQAMISNDYLCETYQPIEKKTSSWMQYLFHKNDGYLVPICLAPFRDVNGAVNMVLENELIRYRLSAIYLYYRQQCNGLINSKESLIDDYSIQDIYYFFNPTDVYKRFSEWTESSITANPIKKYKSSMFAYILQHFGFWDIDLMNQNSAYHAGCVHLVTKILNIIKTYPDYRKYKPLIYKKKKYYDEKQQHRDIMISVPMNYQKTEWDDVLQAIDNDKTHITYKISQTKTFLKYIQDNKDSDISDWILDEKGFTFDTYFREIYKSNMNIDFGRISESLPPSFFDIDIRMAEKNDPSSELIHFQDLSSGERQYLCVLSTFVYYILNLQSVPRTGTRASYRNIMLVMDEVEICFHPDYQRQFINRLLNLITDFKFNILFNFYILLSTHSPFILSDISKDNILYLEKGKDVSDKIEVNPFCANVNDILDQSFFMENGFSGEFATGKVQDLIKFLNIKSKSSKSGWTLDNAECFIKNIVGDPMIQSALLAMYNQKLLKCNG